MDDIRVDDDPRKQSAKKFKKVTDEDKKRGLGGFLFDWIVKSLLVCIILAIDFTLFANAGSYNIFTSYGSISLETFIIYVGIAAFSFASVLLLMILLPLDNIYVAAIIALIGVGIINQFATFDKQSGLIIAFGEWLSSDVNVMLYKYSHWIIAGIIFVISYVIMKVLKRSLLLYVTLALAGLCGWIVSEAYFNQSKPLFKQLLSNPSSAETDIDDNIVFLSINNLTSINNLKNFNDTSNNLSIAKRTLQNSLAVFTQNKFTIYPNAMIDRDSKAFNNLSFYYNSDGEESSDGSSVIVQDSYFDFSSLHPDTQYLNKNSLFDNLKKKGYAINVYQNSGIDICKANSLVDTCYEKVNYPLLMQSDKVPLIDRTVILAAQWFISLGVIDNVNPILSVARYVFDGVKPYSFYVDKVNAFNSFKVFDMILSDIERKGGKQAYFAVVDLPSDSFFYDEYCDVKPVGQWLSDGNVTMAQTSLGAKQNAYLEQTNCMYGYLNKFMKQLEINGMDSSTTVVVAGLSLPSSFINVGDNDFYRRMQASQQVGLAIKSAKAKKYDIDYSVCDAKQIIGSYFFGKNLCKNLASIKTTDKNIEYIKKMVKEDRFSDAFVSSANAQFVKWFSDWARSVGYTSRKIDNQDITIDESNTNTDINDVVELDEPKIMEQEIKDAAETELESIAKTASEMDQNSQDNYGGVVLDNISSNSEDETEKDNNTQSVDVNGNIAEEVIPNTLFDNGVEVEELNNHDETAVKNEIDEKQIPVAERADNPKQGYDLNKIINEAKMRAQQEEKKTEQKVVAKTKDVVAKSEVTAEKTVNKAAAEVNKQQQDIKNVLFAPQDNGKKLSPEELKKQYHEMLKQAQATSGNTIHVEIVE